MKYPSDENGFQKEPAALILGNYRKFLAKELLETNSSIETQAKALFYAPFAILSHTADTDPVFNYANMKALELFGYDWHELIGLPSRLSAEPVCQSDREKLLKQVSENGYIKDYQGIRLTKTGDRFLIKGATVWNLLDNDRCYVGQAACLKAWEFL